MDDTSIIKNEISGDTSLIFKINYLAGHAFNLSINNIYTTVFIHSGYLLFSFDNYGENV